MSALGRSVSNAERMGQRTYTALGEDMAKCWATEARRAEVASTEKDKGKG